MKAVFQLIALFALFCLCSCITTINRGMIIKAEDISAVKLGLSRKEDVRTILGEPSFTWDDKWYYISTITKNRAFFRPKIVKHDAYSFSFNEDDIVEEIQHFDESDIVYKKIKKQKINTEKPDLHKLFNQST